MRTPASIQIARDPLLIREVADEQAIRGDATLAKTAASLLRERLAEIRVQRGRDFDHQPRRTRRATRKATPA